MPRIRLEGLVKRYGAVEVLHGIDLDMAEHEFTVLVGPSGCGKSTTLRMIAGLESVSGGEIWMGDREVAALDPKDRDIAMVFQDYALYPHMNVARNMSFSLRLQKRPQAEIDKRVREVAEMLGLSAFLDRKPGELSGGQRQRVAMGRALCRDASTFLFDEPLSNLDAKLRGQMRAELAVMRQTVKKNMIYVTHDQIEAMTLADRIVVMHGGHIQQQGTPSELFRRPANKFVAGFLGAPPMNFLEVDLSEEGGVLRATGRGFALALPEALADRARGAAMRKATLGIRPSDLDFAPAATTDRALDLRVVVSEYVGAQSVLICDCGGARVTVEIKSETPVALGETLRFGVRPEGLHLFDPETERAL
ncbi:ABC transporter ATP-binding protein [Roseicyclus mahoneyensis]|jgi:multiple sugar transport system ATP-binding protein|uniref:Carbohydrate ABC transporter ATP-binding protein (CUT1 family) n=1 Tax=Roseicyclus mahoneyensis TaxID=164332 RepID=A0A316GS29_9RHOB|nr:sn-glycerol-3-phosphate ABC transporter ATP-binding protein UgpC [Roseicyclus mahoneyensis]PWK62396.1 carbohydrate ABC transporter ATP-binding protein (CUT1 family) [Roseicyclus mahoneyensis]